jgi:hypothetical protein
VIARRGLILAFAPQPKPAYEGRVIGAGYDRQARVTSIYFRNGSGVWVGAFDHDRFRVERPIPAEVPPLKPENPKVVLRLDEGYICAFSSRGKMSKLMPCAAASSLAIVYPAQANPDLTALWSIDSRIYFTNNDYRNVYVLPHVMPERDMRPQILG